LKGPKGANADFFLEKPVGKSNLGPESDQKKSKPAKSQAKKEKN